MFKRKKKKIGCKTPEFRSKVPMPPINPPQPKEFENAQNIIVMPKHDKIEVWKNSDYIPYKDEIILAYNDTKTIYKIGNGIHFWRDLNEVSIEEIFVKGCVCYDGGINQRYKIKLNLFPKRYM